MADSPVFALAAPAAEATVRSVTLIDESAIAKWRSWDAGLGVALGRAERSEDRIVFAVAPDEWMVLGEQADDEAVDITHVRAMFRVSGSDARFLLSHVCALDLSDEMTPDGSAARTLVAGVATELVRDDVDGAASYLLLMSRSFAHSVWERLVDVSQHV